MSLTVEDMVNRKMMEHAECIFCGTRIDGCWFDAIRYSFLKQGHEREYD